MALTAKRPSRREETHAKLLRDVQDTGGKKRRLNVDMQDTLYREIKARAAMEDRSISEITIQLWSEYLSK